MINIIELFTLREHYINPINLHCSQEQIYNILLLIRSFTINPSRFMNDYDLVDKRIVSNGRNVSNPIQKLFNTMCMTTFS